MPGRTPYSTQGETVKIGVQDDLVTVSDFEGTSDGDIRIKDAITMPTDDLQVAVQSNRGNSVFSDKSDKPISYEMVRPDAITLPVVARRGNGDAVQPPLMTMFESGGCNVANPYNHMAVTSNSATNGVVTGTTDMGGGSDLFNQGFMVELDDGQFYPALANKYTSSTYTADLWMDLPSAPSIGNDVVPMWTATPRATYVSGAKLLTIDQNTRGSDGGTAETLVWRGMGCALGSIGGISIEPESNGDVVWSPTFHAADVQMVSSAMNIESYCDKEKYLRSGGNFRFEFGSYAAGGDISSSYNELIKADIDFGLTTAPVPGVGSSLILNGAQGYMAVYQQATIALQVIMSYSEFDDVIQGTFASKYIGFTFPTTAPADPGGLGIWFPNCYQINNPTWDGSGNFGVATLTYGASAAFNTGGGSGADGAADFQNDDTAMAPWIIAISGKETVSGG